MSFYDTRSLRCFLKVFCYPRQKSLAHLDQIARKCVDKDCILEKDTAKVRRYAKTFVEDCGSFCKYFGGILI